MNVLAIDTSNQALGVAILNNDKVIGEIVTNIAKNHSVRLMPAIDQLMKEVSLTADQLDKIVVAKGPGSYTGVRIGLATAKTFAWALDIPIVGVSSLEVLAYQGRFFDGLICPFFDARRGLVFTGGYQWKNQKLELVFEEKNVAMEDVLSKLAEEKKNVLFLSPDIALHRENIKEVLGDLAHIPEGPYHVARPSLLGLAGVNRQADNTHALTPNYLRLAEAEANWLKAQEDKK
ncbi:tRNA (adenosine(37)-N6)-threonylcarbamoyltransferase complex dimerization subunit type 1 TsaB [Oceanobacillus bengalensis]|uniref:tRNA (Adenosine(37)-N6)-threonylcarbamoyltransferase complex dimerization subunit type 1 TsaB n=1 Tax=Oceanobacillus bengalensis TaxID=1435466 RepID=A0A494YTD4_9BACI|nr:tRNA (adenosine(37)-N6)-threonylcarbamoyltransferase complex dimerization subunit type 1 TsaB [Oceanobacillus bengalensis]RKQ13393.1 tRNA (adenosine(37)-N6)-threonylcarbamoyltransferase complex dimerization subunit type 1 TsaB [Oceanobacillus bengalensis]